MQLVQIVDPVVDEIYIREIKKTVWNGNDWEVKKFYQLKMDRYTGGQKMISWLTDHYGKQKYQITWWKTFDHVIMHEMIYTHWKLCE